MEKASEIHIGVNKGNSETPGNTPRPVVATRTGFQRARNADWQQAGNKVSDPGNRKKLVTRKAGSSMKQLTLFDLNPRGKKDRE